MDLLQVLDADADQSCETEELAKSGRLAKSVIVEYLSDSYLGFASEKSTARDIISRLDALYERKSIATQLALRKKLLGLKLQGDTTLVNHFTTYDDLITELVAAGAKLDESDKVSHLLLTLPTSYDGVITAIETLTEDNLTLAFVKTRLLDHEVKLKNEGSDTSAKVLHVEKFRRPTMDKTNRPNPTRGYNNPNKYHAKKKPNFVKCHFCGRKGHYKRDCYYYKRSDQQQQPKHPERTRTVQAIELTTTAGPAAADTDEFSGFAFMTGEYQMEAGSSMTNEVTFLLDSGASDHIINREDLFKDHTVLSNPVKISIAKMGHFVSATKKGTLNVVSNTGVQGVLEDVLFCPDVPYNLLSVSRMQRAGLRVVFDQQGAHVFDSSGKKLMQGEQLADAMTKPLPAITFQKLRNGMGLLNSGCK